ncbi:MAG: family 10 glycosylhydrolase [Prevotellaceae bacterium]|nr:family 10 glycosylhydrolase [Candidatus Faecinaster equi]
MLRFKPFLLLLSFFVICANAQFIESNKYEIRAMWVGTIGGIDWPRTKATNSITIEKQKTELCDILDKLAAANFNTIILQTRIRSSVIYPSQIEPWDDCLTGRMDKNPGYDPLAFAIEECHKRGMQLHAWVVAIPGNSFAKSKTLKNKALQNRVPHLCIKTNEYWMLDPGIPETANYLADICKEIVSHYDVDGINLDYLRYPEKEIKFSDKASYNHYGKGQSLSTWRRNNINHCMRTIYNGVKAIKPWVCVGCSPLGKYSDLPNHSSHGWNCLNSVYQDAQAWLKEGIVDMLAPMMYFQGENFYPFLFDWVENSNGRFIVPGLGAYFLDSKQRNWSLDIILSEIAASRISGTSGEAYFRSKFVTDNTKNIYHTLKNNLYLAKSLFPPMLWLSTEKPNTPKDVALKETTFGYSIKWQYIDSMKYVIYRSDTYPVDITKSENIRAVVYGDHFDINLYLPPTALSYYAITAVSRYGVESNPVEVNKPLTQPHNDIPELKAREGRIHFPTYQH